MMLRTCSGSEPSGMTGNPSLLAALMTVTSVASLVLLSLLCLRCKRKSKSIKEETQIYNPQTFQRGGSRFAVMRSKTVTGANQITSATNNAAAQLPPALYSVTVAPVADPTYVAPLPIPVYENEQVATVIKESPGIYANIDIDPQSCRTFSASDSQPTSTDKQSEFAHQSDDDYENSDFLNTCQQEDEPDYENQS